jgi:gas vesicle protein
MKSFGSFFAGLITGALIGGVIAYFYAPGSGKESREKLKMKFEDIEKEIGNLKSGAGQKSKKIIEELEKRMSDLQNEIDNLTGKSSGTSE